MNAYEDEVRDEACGFCGREITDSEWDEALPEARKKLDWVISREGDADGERNKPYYLGKLIEEYLTQKAFSQYCENMSRTILQKRRQTNETVPAYT